MSSSLLERDLARLHEQIAQARRKQEKHEAELRATEAELERVSARRPLFDAVEDACTALDRLKAADAEELFWNGFAETPRIAGHLEQAKSRVVRFRQELSGLLERQASLKERIGRLADELDVLHNEVRDAYDRDARREQEYVIEREISPVPAMPRSRTAESEWPFHQALLVALLFAVFFGTVIPLLDVPAPARPPVVLVPERLVSMLRQKPSRPEPPKPKEEKKPGKDQEKGAPQENTPAPSVRETSAARKTARRSGVLAYTESFKELIDETPAARLGAAARLSSQPAAAGPARPGGSPTVLPSPAARSSGGIGDSGISRTIKSDSGKQIGTVDFTRVESKVAELKVAEVNAAEVRQEATPVGSGAGLARTDEEIQIVFDKYKATLYRMYNTELRKDPTLRGRIILRITIEPGGEVSACTVQTNDLRSPELVTQIVARVKKFNFGPKEKASKTTILYPIDFLPRN